MSSVDRPVDGQRRFATLPSISDTDNTSVSASDDTSISNWQKPLHLARSGSTSLRSAAALNQGTQVSAIKTFSDFTEEEKKAAKVQYEREFETMLLNERAFEQYLQSNPIEPGHWVVFQNQCLVRIARTRDEALQGVAGPRFVKQVCSMSISDACLFQLSKCR